MAKAAEYPDVFMQFRTIAHAHHANDHTVLTEAYIETGLEIRGGLGWVIHRLEVEWAAAVVASATTARWAVSTRRAQADMPVFGSKGCLQITSCSNIFTTSGRTVVKSPDVFTYRPPVIIASRYMASYFQESADSADLDGLTSYIRIGYTTLKLTVADYVEIAETWGE